MKTGIKEKLKGITVHKLFDNNRFVIIISLFISVALWLSISINISNPITRVVSSVPVKIDLKNTYAETLDLQLFGETLFTVDAEISGESYLVRQITAEDIIISAQTSGVDSSGRIRLWLNSKVIEGIDGVTINKLSPAYIDAYFDVETTKYFQLTPQIDSQQVAAKDYIQQNEILSQGQIKITGPKSEVEKIDKVYASVEINEPLTQTTVFDCQIKVEDSTGNEPKYLEVGQEDQVVKMTVPILKRKELPLAVDFINQPEDYMVMPPNVSFSPEKIMIAGPESAVDSMTVLKLGKIDFEALSPDENTFSFDVSLPSGVIAIDNVDTVRVTVNLGDMSSKILSVPKENIMIKNIPSADSAELISKEISDVKIIGPNAVISRLDQDAVYAEVDLSEQSLSLGEQQFKVRIYVKNSSSCWAYGEYKIWIRITNK